MVAPPGKREDRLPRLQLPTFLVACWVRGEHERPVIFRSKGTPERAKMAASRRCSGGGVRHRVEIYNTSRELVFWKSAGERSWHDGAEKPVVLDFRARSEVSQ